MARKRKTPKHLAEVIMIRQPNYLAHTENLLRVKMLPLENQGDHVKKLTEAEIIARMDGYNSALEDAMHEAGCYAGFMNVGPEVIGPGGVKIRTQARLTDPEFREWRRAYFTNGIARG